MEKLLQKKRSMPNHSVGFFKAYNQNRYLQKLRTEILSLPYLINLFLISCSSAELISSSIDNGKCKAILGLIYLCKQETGLMKN
jgi:hypothetical protein